MDADCAIDLHIVKRIVRKLLLQRILRSTKGHCITKMHIEENKKRLSYCLCVLAKLERIILDEGKSETTVCQSGIRAVE